MMIIRSDDRTPTILVVDDNEINRDILVTRLASQGYDTLQAVDGEQALAMVSRTTPDLILLDIMMPKIDGLEVCRRLKSDPGLPYIPIILVTAKGESENVITGLDAGADEYLVKPIDQAALVARVRSALRMKSLHDEVRAQAEHLRAQAEHLATLNRTLEARVAKQVAEIERVGRLRQFLSPQVAELVLSSGGETLLQSHRRDVTVVFCDLRGFTAFAEIAEPEEVILILHEYHAALGALINKYEATVERFAGDGLLVLFNDPLPCPDPARRAVLMSIEMRGEILRASKKWQATGHELGFGIGIASGHATLGCIGFEGRFQYSATGTVANLASRLCDQASDGQILVDAKVCASVEHWFELQPVGEMILKGLHRPVKTFNVLGQKSCSSDGKAAC
jgi:adenylate cyclase